MHELRWSMRASFFHYVAGLRDGRASVSDGASLIMDDPQLVVYPADPERTTDQVLAFGGDLRLGGHGGLLFVRLARPRITVGATEREPAVLSVNDPMTPDKPLSQDDRPTQDGRPSQNGAGRRLDLVTLRLVPTLDGWAGVDVRLTEAGVGLFNNVYAAGAPFDPLTITRR
ncbi:HtaA domain-containing protein [Parafrankia sp. FMc2]